MTDLPTLPIVLTFCWSMLTVFLGRERFYEGSREIMEKMVKCGKPVCIVSNTTQLAEAAINSYRKRGLEPQRHFTDMVTSGDAARETFAAGGLDIDGNRIFVSGIRASRF